MGLAPLFAAITAFAELYYASSLSGHLSRISVSASGVSALDPRVHRALFRTSGALSSFLLVHALRRSTNWSLSARDDAQRRLVATVRGVIVTAIVSVSGEDRHMIWLGLGAVVVIRRLCRPCADVARDPAEPP